MALQVTTKVSVVKPQFDSARAIMTLKSPRSPLDTIACVRAEGEVGVQRDTQDFSGSHLFNRATASPICTWG